MSRARQLATFAAIGVVNTGVYYALFRLLLLGLPYLPSHVLAFAGAIVVSFLLNCAFTFRVRPTWRRFVRFPLVNLGTFVVMTTGVTALVEVVHLPADVAALVAALAAVPLTFVLARLVLVGRRPRHAPVA